MSTPTVATMPITSTEAWGRLVALDPDSAQVVFREVMEAFSRPGTLRSLPVDILPVGLPAAALPVLALADIMTPIGALSREQPEVDEALTALVRVTGARVVPVPQARFVLSLLAPAGMDRVFPGSHWSPETGATLVQRVDSLEIDDEACCSWRLTGPGIDPGSVTALRVGGLDGDFVAARAALVGDYPAGVDCLLVTDDGRLVALPRTTRIEEI